jgi:hypothetical protein
VVLGFHVEEVVAVQGDLFDGRDAGADVGLGGPVGEFNNREAEFLGGLGEAGVTLEPGFEAGVVGAGEGWVGMGEGRGHWGECTEIGRLVNRILIGSL